MVLEGEIHLLLDEAEVRLGAGDVVVQQGTNHAWFNRGTVPCRLAMVFIDAQEPAALLRRSRSERGDLDREILMVEVKGGKQAVVETLPPLKR